MSHIVTRIGWAAVGLALVSATVFGTAGSATADSPSLTIQGSPMPVQVGGTYWVVDDLLNPSGATTKSMLWIPTTAGTRTLQVKEGSSAKT
ncbi:hypothetical protein [Nocardia tengchongensis]|uniref:hypothetical protein n=1 Tax=Nocardia tengchongensis TaxID=2055889 RepID=UPI0036B79AA9